MIWASDIASYFLWKFGGQPDDPISNLKLQKLLYYAQGYHFAKFDESLFADSIEAWLHGPVVRSVYKQYSSNDAAPIPRPDSFDIGRIPEHTRSLLDRVYQAYGQYTALKLREMTHEEPPWLMAYAEGESSTISNESIRAFFKARLRTTPSVAYTPVETRIQTYSQQYPRSFGRHREALREVISRIIRSSRYRTRYLGYATKLILSMSIEGPIDEAVALLVSSGPDAMRELVSETLPLMPPNEDNGDYWYVLIRAMGFLGKSSEVSQFVGSPYVRIREAVVSALGDLRDDYSLELLRTISSTDRSQFIQRMATELLQELSMG